jgi:hypothetical protein
MNQNIKSEYIRKYKLSKEQAEAYEWLKEQNINTDDGTLCYWVKSYASKRIQEVVNFAKARQEAGQNIQNIGGWIQKFLKTGQAVVNENCRINEEFLEKFINSEKWGDLKVFEKYVKDTVTGEDLPLTLACDDFKRALEALYRKSQLYK